MTQAAMVTIDRFPVKDLPGRYGLGRTQEYERRKFLGIEATKEGGTYYVSGDDLMRLDALHHHLKSGGSLADFGTFGEQSEPLEIAPSLPHLFSEQSELMRLIYTLLPIVQRSLPAAQPLANLEALDRACEKGWLLSTSQLAELLGMKSIGGQAIERYGFRFNRVGRNGREGAWRIEKLNR